MAGNLRQMDDGLASRLSISVEGVGKRYRLGSRSDIGTLGRSLASALRLPLVRAPVEPDAVWALDGVSFEVAHGEVLGLVGRNGAGKSTLLKILARITEPTHGVVRVRGNVAALLEVGTGFHPELTGRENVYLNGAILGMRRAEIRRKFDDIVAFADVDRFIDTPVKYYSSGMHVRLGFAVAAYLQPEILLVDEVLAVGDAAFQRRCLGKMDEVASQGRTVIFVSHNMSTITRLCSRAILLDHGRIVASGDAGEVVERYLREGAQEGGRWWSEETLPDGPFRPVALVVRQREEMRDSVSSEEPFAFEFDYEVREPLQHLLVQLHLRTAEGFSLITTQDRDDPAFEDALRVRAPGRYRASVTIPGGLLNEGRFVLGVNVTTRPMLTRHFIDLNAVVFDVFHVAGVGMHIGAPIKSALRPLLPWTTERVDGDAPVAVAPSTGATARR